MPAEPKPLTVAVWHGMSAETRGLWLGLLGVVIFVIFMYTANRSAFSRVVDTIMTSILVVFLFRDSSI